MPRAFNDATTATADKGYMYRTITLAEVGQVGYIRLNRPRVRNALSTELVVELESAARQLDGRRHLKVVVFAAVGESFCSGFDLREFESMDDPAQARESVDAGRRLMRTVSTMRATTIAAVQGHCVGGGVILMMACDFRYASSTASFRLPEAEIGFPLAWGGTTWLTREVGPMRAAQMILMGQAFSGAEAQALGLVNASVDPERLVEVVDESARVLASRPALVLEMTKAQICAARRSMAAEDYAYSDAHAFHSALADPESAQVREDYLKKRSHALNVRKPLVKASS